MLSSLTKNGLCIHDNKTNKKLYKSLRNLKTFINQTSIENIEKFSDLPQNAQDYIMYLSEELNTPIEIISVGPKRHQIIIHK